MTAGRDIRAYGSRALLVTPGGGVRPVELAAVLGSRPDIVEVVPAAETVLVLLRDRGSRDSVADWLASVAVDAADGEAGVAGRDVVIDVVYDGEDLADVAAATGLSVDDVVALHAGGSYVCEFCGFAPGFAYLSGRDPRLELPRRASPRTIVPAGSVAIAGPYTAVYPSASPGGWHLLGHTDMVLWDTDADPPALLTPGTRVTFTESGRPQSREPGLATPGTGHRDLVPLRHEDTRILVVRAGISTSLQDAGRAGYAALGVPLSGALDARKRALVNRLVGNPAGAAVIETAGGLVLEALQPIVVADSTSGAVRSLPAGDRITADPRAGELYAYVAVRGGLDVDPVLGSRSWDTLSKLGPPPPESNDELRVGPDPRTDLPADLAPPPAPRHAVAARVAPGPRREWFASGAFGHLLATNWTITPHVSRIGIRLSGPPLERHPDRAGQELPSEGLITGAIQVPPDGQPVVMLDDHPTTGGYPVIGVVNEADLATLVQAPPGTAVRLREDDP